MDLNQKTVTLKHGSSFQPLLAVPGLLFCFLLFFFLEYCTTIVEEPEDKVTPTIFSLMSRSYFSSLLVRLGRETTPHTHTHTHLVCWVDVHKARLEYGQHRVIMTMHAGQVETRPPMLERKKEEKDELEYSWYSLALSLVLYPLSCHMPTKTESDGKLDEGGQACDQEAAVQQIFQQFLLSFGTNGKDSM